MQSWFLNFSSSSTNASSFDDDRQFCRRQLDDATRRGTYVEVQATQDTLARFLVILSQVECFGFQVNGYLNVAHRAFGLKSVDALQGVIKRTLCPRNCCTSRYCLMHSRSNTCLQDDMIASSAYVVSI